MGWLDIVLLKRALQLNSVTSLCLTKLDVLAGLSELQVCHSYKLNGQTLTSPPMTVEDYNAIEPIYETLPGWEESLTGVETWADLPENAKKYVEYIEGLIGVPIDIISTSPERKDTIVRKTLL